MSTPPQINLHLDLDQVNIVLTVLNKQPREMVNRVCVAIEQQTVSQMQEAEKVEKERQMKELLAQNSTGRKQPKRGAAPEATIEQTQQ